MKKTILIIDNTDAADASFNAPLQEVITKLTSTDTIRYNELPDADTIAELYGGVILSGVPSHYGLDTISGRQDYLGWIQDTTLPVMGICLGHEIIGGLFGSSLIESEEAEDGVCVTRALQDDSIFKGIPPQFTAAMNHWASISLPEEFVQLASSERCRNVVMKHSQKPLYGFQFHPELSPDGEVFFRNFIELISQ